LVDYSPSVKAALYLKERNGREYLAQDHVELTQDKEFITEVRSFFLMVVLMFDKSCNKANFETMLCASVQEAALHEELHPPQPLHLLHFESCGRVGERRHPLQQNLAVLQPAVSGEVTSS